MINKRKLKVGVIMGGRSGEHEVSVISADSVIKALDKTKYEVIPIGITKTGKWISGPETIELLKSQNQSKLLERILLPDPNKKGLIAIDNGQISSNKSLDVIIPVLHGTYGEDGKIQGLFELANIAYVGAGVLGSAVGMDKVIMKKLFQQAGLKTPNFVYIINHNWQNNQSKQINQIENELRYPVFVKPANLGSSVGINKAKNKKNLIKFINQAFLFDRRVIIEQAVNNAREIECGILGNDKPKASVPGEIIPGDEFYSYKDKYIDDKSELIIPAPLNKVLIKQVQEFSIKAFKLLDLAGMARVDFFLENNQKLFINEVNTIPGFTSISMYPKLWEASGISYSQLLDNLIKLALERHKQKQKFKTSYNLKPKI